MSFKGTQHLTECRNERKTNICHPKTVRTSIMIKKVDALAMSYLYQNVIMLQEENASGTLSKIIHKDMKGKEFLNPKVCMLLQRHIAGQKTNFRKLYTRNW